MCLHEIKYCPRCIEAFDCNPGNIIQCQCYGIELTEEVMTFLEQRFNDCLCWDCLQYLQQEHNLSKEKKIPE